MGGFDGAGTALATVESYSPGTMTWTTVVSMPTARGGDAAALGLDGRIYAFGGFTSGFAAVLATNQTLSGVGGFSGSGLVKSPDPTTWTPAR
jgi:hypothetical protein